MKLINKRNRKPMTGIDLNRRGLTKEDAIAWLIILPSLLAFYLVMWRPMFFGIKNSFYSLKGYEAVAFKGFDNYIRVVSNTVFPKLLTNTLSYVLYSLLIGYLPPFIFAVILNEMVHMKGYFKFSMYFPVIVPSVAVYLIWYFFYQPGPGGLLNYFMSFFGMPPSAWLGNGKLTIPLIVITMSWHGFGATMVMYLAVLQGINQELYEAARIDGAGIFMRVRTVLLPHMRSILLLMGVKQVISVFQVMEQPLMMTGGGPNNASISLALQTYKYAFEYYQMDLSLALGVITFLILLVLTVVYAYLERKCE